MNRNINNYLFNVFYHYIYIMSMIFILDIIIMMRISRGY
jgi:uncharacterized sodium:solute symporter family permease YidK